MAKKKLSFEEALLKIEEIAENLENKEIPLEKSILLYKEAMELSCFCTEKLEGAQQEVLLLQEKADGSFQETPFQEIREEL